MQAVGWLSAACLAACAFPQTVKTLRTRSAADLSWAFLLLWLSGELLGAVYLWGDWDRLPIIANYLVNAALIVPIVAVKGGAWQR